MCLRSSAFIFHTDMQQWVASFQGIKVLIAYNASGKIASLAEMVNASW